MKPFLIRALLILTVLSSCNLEQNPYEEEGNLKWRLLRFSESNKSLKNSNLIQFNWELLDEKDSLIYQKRFFIQVDSLEKKEGILHGLRKLKVGESGLFLFDNKFLSDDFKAFLVTADVNFDNKNLVHKLTVDDIFTQEEFENNKHQFLDWISKQSENDFNSLEDQVINNYIEVNELKMKTLPSGLRLNIKHSYSNIKTRYGKYVVIEYAGGQLAKPNTHTRTKQDFYIGQEFQVIRAIEEALLHMEMGDTAEIIAPSELAFGEKGSSTGIIPGGSPVQYEIYLKECEE